ncbi:MAG: stage IV sporulation protein A [Firmicutes bacterium]|nr:stage IV sporulation protein A [Bacillota bacterium]
MAQSVFNDIATRTNGEVYIGVVGPVRAGKSTFISNFMQRVVTPKIRDQHELSRLTDELPQSGDGTGIMTTQPRFVPRDAVSIQIAKTSMKIRMVDCVGYLIEGATGHDRMVKTPWSDAEMPFEKAAEIGTKKVIREHSTIAIVMTTDGTITDIPRQNYIEAEERVINQLKKLGKPFVVAVNSRNPDGDTAKTIAAEMAKKHGVGAIAINAHTMTDASMNAIFTALMNEFPVTGFRVNMPSWLSVLPADNEMVAEAITALKAHTTKVKKMADNNTGRMFEKSLHFASLDTVTIEAATGVVSYNLTPKPDLYFRVLSNAAGAQLGSEAHLVSFLGHAATVRTEYAKIKSALDTARDSGYGIVEPQFSEFNLERPTLHKSGKNFGVRFRATAPSLHIVRVDVGTLVTPSIGTRGQSEEMLNLLTGQFDTDPSGLWPVPIFGKSLESLVREGIQSKSVAMPVNARLKMKRTLSKIVNTGRGGLFFMV